MWMPDYDFLAPINEIAGRKCFQSCPSVCSGERGPLTGPRFPAPGVQGPPGPASSYRDPLAMSPKHVQTCSTWNSL